MENPKQQLIDRIKSANNVLVTVSSNPSVDQLSAAIGLTLMLNKMGKHGTAVFSGEVPSTIEFLQPEKTLEKTTDSLRDFIIALDKSKADKLRYKVEDSHVKIFITPYRTSITDKDLDFSQGDFNVEVVVALGVNDQKDLDQAITAHGRILHDATTISVTNGAPSTLGSINWADGGASSLCEMVSSLAEPLQKDVLDGQMATALMTGIVAETQRFSNEKTSPATMSLSAALMSAGANQQLVASKLQEQLEPKPELEQAPLDTPQDPEAPAPVVDGSLDISHDEPAPSTEMPDPVAVPEQVVDEIKISEDGTVENVQDPGEPESPSLSAIQGGSSLILDPPSMGGKLTANSEPESLDPSTDPLGVSTNNSPLLSHQDAMPTSAQNDQSFMPTEAPSDQPLSVDSTPSIPVDAPAEEPLEPDAPAMELPSELPQITSDPSPSEQSLTMPEPPAPVTDVPAEPPVPEEEHVQTLSDLEAAVRGSYESVPSEPPAPLPTPISAPDALSTEIRPTDVNDARDAVFDALTGSNEPLPPIAALNAHPLDLEIKQTGQTGIIDTPPVPAQDDMAVFTMPENLVPQTDSLPFDPTATSVASPTDAPALPPPLTPDVYGAFTQQSLGQDNGAQLPPQNDTAPPQTTPGNPFNLPPA